MDRGQALAGVGVMVLGLAALAAVFAATEPGSGTVPPPREGGADREAARLLALPATPGFAPAPEPAPAPAPPPPPAGVGEPPAGSVAQFDSPEDRAQALGEMQAQRKRNGIEALNARAARRAALARSSPPSR